jgi:hypothetical protein
MKNEKAIITWDISNHLASFPHSVLMEKEDRLWGCWMIGNYYKREIPFHGAYPPKYLERVYSLFPKHQGRVMHLFSGSLKDDTYCRVDTNVSLLADVAQNAELLVKEHFDYCPKHKRPPFNLVIADPPYSKADANIYGTNMPTSHKVFRSLYDLVEKDGLVVWLSTRRPINSSKQWEFKGIISLDCGSNRLLRGIFIYRKKEEA